MNDIESLEEPKTGGGAYVGGSVDTAGGNFVGRDQSVFMGRDIPAQQIVTIEGNVQGDVVIYPSTTLGRIGTQIERLRGRITRLIPAEDALLQLARLREPKPIEREFGFEITAFEHLKYRLVTRPIRPKNTEVDNQTAQDYLKRLGEIEAQVGPNIEPEKWSHLLQNLSTISDEINIHIAQLNSLFASIVYPATSSRELVENMVSKIGHREFRDEANMHLGVIGQLVQKLNPEMLTHPNFDVLSDEAYGAVGLMTELEKRRLVVEKLVQADRNRRNWTVGSVIAYICAIIALTVVAVILWGAQFVIGRVPLNQLRMPLLGIPWPVVLWSLIGSFAAMIHRFNSNPIYDFTDAVKWMITRPVQGVVLGSTMYLILVSGLFILTAGSTSNPSGLISTDEVILVLCFLVGFSDRFADSVFNALVQRYSKESKNAEQKNENKN